MQNYLTKGTRLQDTYLIEGAIYEKKDRIGYLATYPDGQVLLEEYYSKDLAEREADSLTVRPLNEARFLSGMERFEKEGKALCELAREEERGIIRCLGAFRENGTAYLVYERKNGVTLDAYIRENGAIPVYADARDLLLPVMEAVGKLHAFGIVHGSISPSNILLTDTGALLLTMGENWNRTSDIMRTTDFKPYAAPEQFGVGGKIGPWTDVYALAKTLLFLVTGEVMDEEHTEFPKSLEGRMRKDLFEALKKGAQGEIGQRTKSIEAFLYESDPKKKRKRKMWPFLLVGCIAALCAAGAAGYQMGMLPISTSSQSPAASSLASVPESAGSPESGAESVMPLPGEDFEIYPGTYQIKNAAAPSLLLAIEGGYGENGAPLVLTDHANGNASRFAVYDNEGDRILIARHTESKLIINGKAESGTWIVQDYNAQGTAWEFHYMGHDEIDGMDYIMITDGNGNALAPSEGLVPGSHIALVPENPHDKAEMWYFAWSEKDKNEEDTKVLDIGHQIWSMEGTYTFRQVQESGTYYFTIDDEKNLALTLDAEEARPLTFTADGSGAYRVTAEDEEGILTYLPEEHTARILPEDEENGNARFRIIYAGKNTYFLQAEDDTLIGTESEKEGLAAFRMYDDYSNSTVMRWKVG